MGAVKKFFDVKFWKFVLVGVRGEDDAGARNARFR